MKRALDVLVAGMALVALLPLLVLFGILVRLESRGPALFRQVRVGRGFRPFVICKFRSMVVEAALTGGPITGGGDPRVTRLGRLLRRFHLDELPQLWNVLRGDMSLVGPRPEVPCYVAMFPEDYTEILAVRPGAFDLAGLAYPDEPATLARARDAEEEYVRRILPEKLRLGKEYVRRASLRLDLEVVARSVAAVLGGRGGG